MSNITTIQEKLEIKAKKRLDTDLKELEKLFSSFFSAGKCPEKFLYMSNLGTTKLVQSSEYKLITCNDAFKEMIKKFKEKNLDRYIAEEVAAFVRDFEQVKEDVDNLTSIAEEHF